MEAFIMQWYWIPMLLVYTTIIITLLGENRNPSKSLAYILVLIFLPVAGIIIWFFVGKKPAFKKPVFDKQRKHDEERMRSYYSQLKPQMEDRLERLQNLIGDMHYPFRYLYNLQQSLISEGNETGLLNNGETFFPALFDDLRKAQHHIHIEYYILTADDIGNQLTDILIQKRKEGVEVRVLVDAAGSNNIKNLPERMKEAGIEVLRTLPVRFTSLANSNYRNHRKIVVIDGKIGYTGGINLDERYINNGKHPLYWRDTAVRIEGTAANLLQVQFFLMWLFSGGNMEAEQQAKYFTQPQTKGNAIVSIAASGPSSASPYIMEAIVLAISQAKQSVCITTPYFIPTDQLVSALVIAATNGVSVELILPRKSDSRIVQHASFSYLKPLLLRGVKVYLYDKGFIHSKTVFIDSRLAFIGTPNMDTRSFFLNFEITSIIHEEELCKSSEASFNNDKQNSTLVNWDDWKNRSVWQRGLDSVCRLIAPLL